MDVEGQGESEYYHHSGSANPNSSDSNSDGEMNPEDENGYYVYDSRGPYYDYTGGVDPEIVYARFLKAPPGSEEDDAKEEEKKLVDPGPFRYNKRVFVTALPCILLTLVMTGETLLFLVTAGGLVIILMAQVGEDVSRRCVVVFALLFVPAHFLVVGTVLPLICFLSKVVKKKQIKLREIVKEQKNDVVWLTAWNLFLVAIVNFFFILTGGWIIIQFVAFRTEETSMCTMIEQGLFACYPMICSALVTWVLSTVVSSSMVPFIFVFIWFVCLQLYLLPAVSSFRQTETPDEDMNVLQQPILIVIVLVFVFSGPFLHVALTVVVKFSLGMIGLSWLATLCLLACLGLFLSTLLSIRQLCEYLGFPYHLVVKLRWLSGVGVVLLSYPVLQQLGLNSHFLQSLPVAVSAFTALGLRLSLKKGKAMSLVLMVGLMMLLGIWLFHLPWTLTFNFLGIVPLRSFYLLVAVNFVLCVFAIFAAWHGTAEVFGLLLLLQSVGMVVCELGLYQAGLYSLATFQLTGLGAAYAVQRLYLASKVPRNLATLTSAVQLTKPAISTLGYLMREKDRAEEGGGVVEISLGDFLTLFIFVAVLTWMFVYETKEDLTLWEAAKHLSFMMLSMAISGQSFLVPVSYLLLQDDPTLANLVGLWYGLGGLLVLLYALQHGSQPASTLEELTRVAVILGGVGALVVVMQPGFAFSLYTLYQWTEVLSILLIAAVVATGVKVGFTQMVVTAFVLGVCPGIHATFWLYGQEATVVHFILVSAVTCILLAFSITIVKTEEVSDAEEKFFQIGTVSVISLLLTTVIVDIINLDPDLSVWNYPAWQLSLAAMAIVAMSLKSLAVKLGPQSLPMSKRENKGLPLVPIIGNAATLTAFVLARTQGPEDSLLYDLWCCASSVFLIFLQRDSLVFHTLSPSNQATPTVMAAIGTLVLSTLAKSHLWALESVSGVVFGFFEIVAVFGSLPVYIVLAGIMWRGEIWSEKAVVFTLPMNAFVCLLGSTFTAWALGMAGFVCGVGMMMTKLPLLPYHDALVQR